MKFLRTVVVGCFALAPLLASTVHSEVVEQTAGELRFVGKTPQDKKRYGMGRSVKLKDAVRQILPEDIELINGPGAEKVGDIAVSWQGGRAWSDVLSEVVASVPNAVLEVDTKAKTALLSAPKLVPPTSTPAPSSVGRDEARQPTPVRVEPSPVDNVPVARVADGAERSKVADTDQPTSDKAKASRPTPAKKGKSPEGAADQCKPVSEYSIAGMNFPTSSLESALKRLVGGTPLQLQVDVGYESRQVGAENVTGDLGTVLQQFAEETGTAWTQKGCVLVVTRTTPQAKTVATEVPAAVATAVAVPVATQVPLPQQWTIRQGQRFSDAMSEWCKKAACKAVYWETAELESELPQSLGGSFEDAVEAVISALYSQGIPIRAEIYDGNGVVRVLRRK